MAAYLNYVESDNKQDYIGPLFQLLKLKPNYTITKPERCFVYFLMIQELLNFERFEIVDNIRNEIKSGETIHRVFINLIKNDSDSILYYFNSEMSFYDEEDFASIFFI